jgi:hypothetical protein
VRLRGAVIHSRRIVPVGLTRGHGTKWTLSIATTLRPFFNLVRRGRSVGIRVSSDAADRMKP